MNDMAALRNYFEAQAEEVTEVDAVTLTEDKWRLLESLARHAKGAATTSASDAIKRGQALVDAGYLVVVDKAATYVSYDITAKGREAVETRKQAKYSPEAEQSESTPESDSSTAIIAALRVTVDEPKSLADRVIETYEARLNEHKAALDTAAARIRELERQTTNMKVDLYDLVMLEGTTDAGELAQRRDILQRYE